MSALAWSVEERAGPDGYDTHVVGEDGETVAVVGPWVDGETQTNARLIAAAPELLAVAERVERYLARQGWRDDSVAPESELLRDARAAIAKAKGTDRGEKVQGPATDFVVSK